MLIMGMPGSHMGNICDFWLFTDRDGMCFKECGQQNCADLVTGFVCWWLERAVH